MNKIISGVLSLVVLGIVSFVSFEFFEAYEPKPQVLQGEIDASSYSVSSKVPGRIADVLVKKGQDVKKGDLIFVINSPEVEAKVKQAIAAKNAASAKKDEANAGARKQQVQAAFDQYQKAKAASELMQKTYNRVNNLFTKGVVPEQKRDEVYTKWQASKYTQSAAHQMYVMAKEGARSELKQAALSQENIYKGKVDEAMSYLEETKQYAYHDGEVSQILIHEGELAPTGFPIVTLIDMNDAWAIFHIREDVLSKVKKGDIYKMKIPALGDDLYEFKVTHIAVQGDFATWKSTQGNKSYDMKSFEVELFPVKPIDGLRVGMSVLLTLNP